MMGLYESEDIVILAWFF